MGHRPCRAPLTIDTAGLSAEPTGDELHVGRSPFVVLAGDWTGNVVVSEDEGATWFRARPFSLWEPNLGGKLQLRRGAGAFGYGDAISEAGRGQMQFVPFGSADAARQWIADKRGQVAPPTAGLRWIPDHVWAPSIDLSTIIDGEELTGAQLVGQPGIVKRVTGVSAYVNDAGANFAIQLVGLATPDAPTLEHVIERAAFTAAAVATHVFEARGIVVRDGEALSVRAAGVPIDGDADVRINFEWSDDPNDTGSY